jgi:hypothetical protein
MLNERESLMHQPPSGQPVGSIPGDQDLWRQSLVDPFRERLLAAGESLPEAIRHVAEPLRGEPALDPRQIEHLAERLALPANTRFPHPLLERVVRVGLAHIEATFQGDHPKYGVGTYAEPQHDGFPPTIIAAVDALTRWGMTARAEQLFSYWLHHFVREDGTIDYYGPSLSEYGQLLHTARELVSLGGSLEWLRENADSLMRMGRYLQDQIRKGSEICLPAGVPEADERGQTATYFHNAAWIHRGLGSWAALLGDPLRRGNMASAIRGENMRLRQALQEAIRQAWPRDRSDWWLRPMLEEEREGYWQCPQGRITANRLGSYTNYRYWPELLSSAALPKSAMRRIVDARLTDGGQFCGVTRFQDHLDDWPLYDYLHGFWMLGMKEEYRLCLWGHILLHQAEGHLTAYEQVTFPPGRKVADYCLPCQLVAVRAAPVLLLRSLE